MRRWEGKVLRVPGAPERVAQTEGELRAASQIPVDAELLGRILAAAVRFDSALAPDSVPWGLVSQLPEGWRAYVTYLIRGQEGKQVTG